MTAGVNAGLIIVDARPPDDAAEGFGDIADWFAWNLAAKHPDIAAVAGQFINQLYRPVVEVHQSPCAVFGFRQP